MSSSPAPIAVGRARRRCKFCRELGHDLRKCEKWQARQSTAPEPSPLEGDPEHEPDCTCGARGTGMVCICAMRGITIERAEPPPGLDPEIAAIAALRELLDGIEIENAEYRRIVAELEQRIDRNRTRAVTARAELALLRARRGQSPP